MPQEITMMLAADECVYDQIVDVVIEPVAKDHGKNAVVTMTLGSADGKRVRYSLTVKAALILRSMISHQLKFLVSDSPPESGQ